MEKMKFVSYFKVSDSDFMNVDWLFLQVSHCFNIIFWNVSRETNKHYKLRALTNTAWRGGIIREVFKKKKINEKFH